MRKLIPALSLFSALLLSSCAGSDLDCSGLCQQIYPDIVFKIVNSTGQNLVAGPNKLYTSDKIAIKSLINGVLVNENYYGFSGDSTQAATSLLFTASSVSSQYYLYINNVKTDSLQIVYKDNLPANDCCADFYSITSLKLNNVNTTYIYPNGPGPLNIVK
jgi:hypothetical protein